VLLHELTARAREEGIERFSALVLADNTPMLELLRELGHMHVTDRDHGVVELVMDLPCEGIPQALRHTVRAAARGDITLDPRHPVAEGEPR
jgi:RimJ/RimL family protein N-acetyltransferase